MISILAWILRDHPTRQGAGLYVFAVVASTSPLAAFDEWPLTIPWTPTDGRSSWQFDGESFEPLATTRGPRERTVPTSFKESMRHLREKTPEGASVHAVAFPVRPNDGGEQRSGSGTSIVSGCRGLAPPRSKAA